MSRAFNDVSGGQGLVQLYEDECGFEPGSVSGSTARLKRFTADANGAFDKLWEIALRADGRWQIDDTNYTDSFPIIYTDTTAGRRDYSFVVDGEGALILRVHRLFYRDTTSSAYQELAMVDQQSDPGVAQIYDGLGAQGIPYRADKSGNTFFLDPVPAVSCTAGLKAMVDREAERFAYTDTTKKPGFPGLFHDYVALEPARNYARRKGLGSYADLDRDVKAMEKAVEAFFGRRDKTEKPIMRPAPTGAE